MQAPSATILAGGTVGQSQVLSPAVQHTALNVVLFLV